MPRHKRVEVKRSLEVTGRTWEGLNKCDYSYGLSLDAPIPRTYEAARKIAVDFEILTSAEVVTVHREINEVSVRSRIKWKE